MKRVLIGFFAMLLSASAFAEVLSEVVDGVRWYYALSLSDYHWDVSSGRYVYGTTNATVTSGTVKYAGDLSVPSKLGGFPVTSIGSSAFYDCSLLTSVTISDGVTWIGYEAFSNCGSLTAVMIPEGVTSIEDYTFYGCRSLARFDVPASVTSIGSSVLHGCDKLTEITVAAGNANYKAVGNCLVTANGKTLVAVPYGSENIDVPAGVTEIPSYMFSEDTALKTLTIPEGVEVIEDNTFRDCSSLVSVTIPEGVLIIGRSAFYGCESLTSVTIPDGVETIEDYTFFGCSALTSVAIPEGVTSIGYGAFNGCSMLTSVTIPEGVEVIEDNTFRDCSSLVSVTIPESVLIIGRSAFYGCESLTSVTIPDGVETIENYTFFGCSALTSVAIPEGVTSIGYGAFNGCSMLMSVTIPEGVETIGSYAFCHCGSLVSVTIPESVESIGYDAFCNCSSLTSVTIPAGVTSIGSSAFYGCSSLSDVVLLGPPPQNVGNSGLLSCARVSYPREHGAAWMKVKGGVSLFQGFNRWPKVAVLSSQIRANDPTVLDVVYQVTSTRLTVKVRALAFEDGERSFAKVVRPETFVADTNGVETVGNVGDAIVPNVPHTLSWRVSSDWSNRLAKVSFEVLATEGELLPLEVRTIPASDAYGKMDVTWNAITENQWFDALLWLYADKDKEVELLNGKLKSSSNGTILAEGAHLFHGNSYYYDSVFNETCWFYNAPAFVFQRMGYTLLSGEVLNYVNEETRLGLRSGGYHQYGYKIVSEK